MPRSTRSLPLPLAPFVLCALVFAPALAAEDAPMPETKGDVVRLLTPPGRSLAGKTEVEVLVIDPEVRSVVFSLDGSEVARRKKPPWRVKIDLAKPAREQMLRVEALGPGDRVLGDDSLVVNRRNPPLRVRITGIEGEPAEGKVVIHGRVSLPRGAELGQVEVFRNDDRVARALIPEFTLEVPTPDPRPTDFVRALATLVDGRQVEDVVVLSAPGVREEIDVDLVQLQVLVTGRSGAPVSDLARDDFSIRQGGAEREIAQFAPAENVALTVGLVLDSSGSMQPIWPATMAAAEEFLLNTLTPKDRAFVVDFDTQLRLVQPPTADRSALIDSLASIEPEGGTALYDSVTFSMLQFRDEPGRRALVVLTDGFDSGSQARPERAEELGRKLGVPVYVVGFQAGGRGGAGLGGGGVDFGALSALQSLELLTDRTGGRLIRVPPSDAGLARAFHQIQHELRRQYVLTFYTDTLPDDDGGDLKVTLPGRRDVEVRAVFGWDQIH